MYITFSKRTPELVDTDDDSSYQNDGHIKGLRNTKLWIFIILYSGVWFGLMIYRLKTCDDKNKGE